MIVFKKIGGVIGAVFIFTLIGGGLGAFIPWYIEGLSFDSETLSGTLYETGLFTPAVAHILSSILMDIPDKALTVLLVVTLLHILPEKV